MDKKKGMVVKVLKEVKKKGIIEMYREMMNIYKKESEGKMNEGEMKGG